MHLSFYKSLDDNTPLPYTSLSMTNITAVIIIRVIIKVIVRQYKDSLHFPFKRGYRARPCGIRAALYDKCYACNNCCEESLQATTIWTSNGYLKHNFFND